MPSRRRHPTKFFNRSNLIWTFAAEGKSFEIRKRINRLRRIFRERSDSVTAKPHKMLMSIQWRKRNISKQAREDSWSGLDRTSHPKSTRCYQSLGKVQLSTWEISDHDFSVRQIDKIRAYAQARENSMWSLLYYIVRTSWWITKHKKHH